MEQWKLIESLLYGAGFFLGGFLTRVGWVRSRSGRGPLSILGVDEPNGKEKPISREEFADVWQELGDIQRALGKVEGRVETTVHCEHCFSRLEVR